jgi:hypothetical protein
MMIHRSLSHQREHFKNSISKILSLSHLSDETRQHDNIPSIWSTVYLDNCYEYFQYLLLCDYHAIDFLFVFIVVDQANKSDDHEVIKTSSSASPNRLHGVCAQMSHGSESL